MIPFYGTPRTTAMGVAAVNQSPGCGSGACHTDKIRGRHGKLARWQGRKPVSLLAPQGRIQQHGTTP